MWKEREPSWMVRCFQWRIEDSMKKGNFLSPLVLTQRGAKLFSLMTKTDFFWPGEPWPSCPYIRHCGIPHFFIIRLRTNIFYYRIWLLPCDRPLLDWDAVVLYKECYFEYRVSSIELKKFEFEFNKVRVIKKVRVISKVWVKKVRVIRKVRVKKCSS